MTKLSAEEADALLETAIACVEAAGAVIRPAFRAPGLATETKSDASPVTRADREAEQAMRAVIASRHPDHAVLGEEGGAPGEAPDTAPDTDPDPGRQDRDEGWILDPIDGTRAFVTGRPIFGTLIAYLHDGEPVLGIVDQPVTGERWIGLRGRPTLFRGPFGGAIGTRSCPGLAEAELSATAPEIFDPAHRPRFDALARACARTSWGGDCYAYGLLSLGRIDVIAEAGMRIWDWAALVPVVEGAGGSVTDWQGRRLRGLAPSSVLAIGDPGLLPQCLAALGPP